MTLDIGVYGARGVPSTYSGYETFLTTLLPALARRGHRVTIYCRDGEGADDTPWQGVQRRVLPSLAGKATSTLSHGLVASVVARRAGHHVVLVVNVANAAYCAIGRLTGQPTVLNTDGQEWLRDKWGPTAKKVFHNSARIAGRCASGLVADCAAMADIYQTEFASPSTVIPYCEPDISWTPDTTTLARFEVEHGKFLVVAGRHNPENNIDRIAEQVADSDLDLPLLVMGTANYDSPVTRRLQQLARCDDRIRPIGHVGERAQFLDLLHHGAIYLHGHSVGGINPSLVEAMSAGARIAALDTPFNREVLGPGAVTFSLDPPDLAPVLAAMLAESEAEDASARDAARQRISSHYAIDDVVDAYEELLSVASRHGRRRHLSIGTRWSTEQSRT